MKRFRSHCSRRGRGEGAAFVGTCRKEYCTRLTQHHCNSASCHADPHAAFLPCQFFQIDFPNHQRHIFCSSKWLPRQHQSYRHTSRPIKTPQRLATTRLGTSRSLLVGVYCSGPPRLTAIMYRLHSPPTLQRMLRNTKLTLAFELLNFYFSSFYILTREPSLSASEHMVTLEPQIALELSYRRCCTFIDTFTSAFRLMKD